MKRPALVLAILMLLFSCRAAYCDNVNDALKGTASFLLDRANATMISMFENMVKSNQYIRQYFPQTTKMMDNFDLKILMLNNVLWKNSVDEDLKSLAVSMLSQEMIENAGAYKKKLKKYHKKLAKKVKQPKAAADTGGTMTALAETKEQGVMETKTKVDEAEKSFDKIIKQAGGVSGTEFNIMVSKKKPRSAGENFAAIAGSMKETISAYPEIWEDVGISSAVIESLLNVKDNINGAVDPSQPYPVRVSKMFDIIEDLKPENIDVTSSDYKKFKKYAMFFAMLADDNAKQTDYTQNVLTTFALPVNSYNAKREDELHWSISSYLGGACVSETNFYNSDTYIGVFAPIGIERSWAKQNGGSLSIFGSVLDLGPVVNSQIYGNNQTFGFKDVTAPGLSLIYGFPKSPFSLGAGGFTVRSLQDDTATKYRFMIFFALDMPLFALD